MPALASQLAEWVSGLRFEQIPAAVTAAVKARLLDTIGVALAGSSSDAGLIARARVIDWSGTHEATLLGETVRVTAPGAALVNGTYAHALDFDDTHLPSILHPSAPLVPAALATAESKHASGEELLVGLVAAYEVACRLGMAQYDPVERHSVFIDRGLHVTSYVGAISSAVVAAKVGKMDAAHTAHSIAVAAGMGAGLIESSRGGGSVKKFQSGWAAQAGIVAAEMVGAGLTGALTALEGRYGLFPALCGDRWSPEAVVDGLGSSWQTPNIIIKPYPCTHYTHAIVDAALRFREAGVRADDVLRVQIGVPTGTVAAIGEPVESKRRPSSPYLAQFSGPFVFACALAGGGGLGVSMADFTAASLGDAVRMAVADQCTVVADELCDTIFPDQFPARVRLTLKDGTVLEEAVLSNRGGGDRPLTRAELGLKLRDTAGTRADAIDRCVNGLEDAPDLEELLRACAADEAQSPKSQAT
jgi:2-methylcitrate dehydratase PrpD